MRQRFGVVVLVLGAVAGLFSVVSRSSGATARHPADTPLIGLTYTSYFTPVTLQHVTPRTLSPEGSTLRLGEPGGTEGLQWARRGDTLAVEVYGVPRKSTPIRIVDAGLLRVRRSVSAGQRDICGLGFDGATLVALAAVPWCNNEPQVKTTFSVLRINVGSGRVVGDVPVSELKPFAYPVSLAFGDGHAYVARAAGAVDSIDLRTGVVTSRRPRRTLAKGGDAVFARWLGEHRLGLGAQIVDVRTWRSRLVTSDAQRLTAGGPYVVAFGTDGARAFTRTGHLPFLLLRGENISDAHVAGHYLYVNADTDTEVFDLRTQKRISVVPHANEWTLLAP